jgi:ABC-type phosphate/phosphonate transport system substrate-binding protein
VDHAAGKGVLAINAKQIYSLIAGIILFAIVIAACGDETPPPPTFTPTVTPTPTLRSTPLPEANTPIPLGSDDRPITLGFVLTDTNAQAIRAVEQAVNQAADNELTIDISTFPSMGTALDAICNGTNPTMAWVDAFTYIAAEQRCDAIAIFGVELNEIEARERNFDIIFSGSLDPIPTTLADIEGKSWCRLDATDTISWIYPSLAMQTANLNPLTALTEIIEVDTYSELVLAVFDGTCDMGAIPDGELRRLSRQLERENRVDEDATEELIIDLVGIEGTPPDIGILLDGRETWPVVPAPVLVAPAEIVLPEQYRDIILQAIEVLSEEESPLAELLGYETIVASNDNDYSAFRTWLSRTNWAMSR